MNGEVEAFQVATRDLVGIAIRSLELLDGQVSVAQFRLLAVLEENGRSPSSRVARALGMSASSVTRLADRLVAGGYLQRGEDPANRSVVTLELTADGRKLVAAVMQWRRAELTRILARLPLRLRGDLADGLRRFHDAVDRQYDGVLLGPMPL